MNAYYHALPPYFGGKRKLNAWIFGQLSKWIPVSAWKDYRFADAFVGGGSVSLFAKCQGFQQLLANDWSQRSQWVIQGLLQNTHNRFSETDLLQLAQPLAIHPGPIEQQFCPSVFSTHHARWLDRLICNAQTFQSDTKKALAHLLIWHLIGECVAFGTSIGTSNRPFAETLNGERDWQTLNPKRFTDRSLSKLLQPVFPNLQKLTKRLNQGIIGGSPVQDFQQDATHFLQHASADILYLDPPYPGTARYEQTYKILDAILENKSQKTQDSSAFSQSPLALDTLLDNARHIPIWILSYGNRCCTLEELVQQVQRHRPNDTVQGLSRNYTHLHHVSKNTRNQELLVLVYPKCLSNRN